MEPTLFQYQSKGIADIMALHRQGKRKILCISPGASGKTVMMASIAKSVHTKQANLLGQDFNTHTGKKVAFFTHREELFNQSREKFLLFGNITEPINAETKTINPNINNLTCMVETFNSRSDSESFLSYFKNVSLVFIDEAHRTDFNKILQHFPTSQIQGFTATPVSADKKFPLNTVWDAAIELAKVRDLQRLNLDNPKVGVVPSDAYSLGKIDRSKLKRKGDDFDEKGMSSDFSDKQQIRNTISGYFSNGKGLKGFCFNCDIKHNEVIHNEFLAAGIESRQIHSNSKKWFGAPKSSLAKYWRKDTIKWSESTPGSIVNNVGILTMGVDIPSLELIMVNHATLSISRWIQEIVRGARPFQYPDGQWKESYKLLDFGKNAQEFGDGNNDIPWLDFFNNPDIIGKREGIGGMKSCPECGNLSPVGARFCRGLREDFLYQEYYECGYCFPLSVKEEDLVPREMVKFFNDGISVSLMIDFAKREGFKVESVYFKILEAVSNMAKKSFGTYLLSEQFDFILDICFRKMRDLSKVTGKKTWRDSVKKALVPKLRESGFIIDVEELGDEEILNELKYSNR